jgi:hypothetical protein
MAGECSAADAGGPGWDWDVALSFAGSQRDYVEQVAVALKARGVRCFYDDERIDLWGRYLAEELPAIYAERAATVVVSVSADYAARDWTRHERRAALDRAVRERREYVLPARFDDTALPGLLSGMVAVDLRTRTLATGGADGAVLLWDVHDPNRPRRVAGPLAGHSGSVASVAFSADGRTLATGSADNTVIVWNVSALVQLRADAVAAACQRVGSDLTRPTWESIIPGRLYRHTCNGRRTEGG